MLYKLIYQNGQTRGGTQWVRGEIKKLPKTNTPKLCSGDVFHAYTNINLAFLLNPIHANIENPQLWAVDGDVVVKDWGKVGCFEMTALNRLKNPSWVGSEIETKIRILFAVLCAEAVLNIYEKYDTDDKAPRLATKAARDFLDNAAADAADAAYAAAHAAHAADAAYAAYAAYAAAYTAYAAHAAHAAAYAAHAAHAAADAAHAAHAAADAAAHIINFDELANEAVDFFMKEEK